MKLKIAYFAAAATLSLAGMAFAQSTAPAGTPGASGTTPPMSGTTPSGQEMPSAQTTPSGTTSATPATPASPSTGTAATPATPASPSASSSTGAAADAQAAGTPSSATVGVDLKVGSEVKDPSGAVVGTIAGTSAGADGSTNVVVTSGDKKFALPKASLSVGADGALATTATKAQIDATLAGAKPQ
jgi:hypothetical protein